jgi:PAS domain S-box-containing protein
LTWNPGVERIKGYAADEIIGKRFSIFYAPEAVAQRHPERELEIAQERGRYEEEGWRVRKDGSRFWAHVVIYRISDQGGKHLGFAKVTRDLTERRRLEQLHLEEQRRTLLLEQSERSKAAIENERENFRNLFSETPEMVCMLRGPDHVFEYVNEAHVKALGFDATGMPLLKAQPESVEVHGILDEVYRTGRTAVLREIGVTLTDRLRYFNLTFAARRDQGGEIDGVMVLGNEITDKILAQRALKKAVQSRDEFVSMASHELKTPITTMILQLQMQRRQLGKSEALFVDLSDFLGFVEKIGRQADRLRRLADDLLDISRITHGKFALEPEEVDLGDLVRDVLDRYSAQMRSAGCKYTATVESGIQGRWDRYRIEQVIINLLTNAVRYGAGKPIEVSVTSSQTHACVTVRDRGIGIEKDKLKHIFEPFERATAASQRVGLGLGLYISKQIVQAHGGDIEVESEPGEGSSFTVKLPLRVNEGLEPQGSS